MMSGFTGGLLLLLWSFAFVLFYCILVCRCRRRRCDCCHDCIRLQRPASLQPCAAASKHNTYMCILPSSHLIRRHSVGRGRPSEPWAKLGSCSRLAAVVIARFSLSGPNWPLVHPAAPLPDCSCVDHQPPRLIDCPLLLCASVPLWEICHARLYTTCKAEDCDVIGNRFQVYYPKYL
ncbi:hypothetical protein B0T19DRAFT_422434 [Cercophora scortea]|uniref:Secreted protein n=1 Tax=Cercophora scortea TaxID=314031 RepID=A0AAE0MCZ2_9PEZI|nr:hypothetical protein B0T19DRAFT_422434 [Cercophora scortea]